MNLIEIKNVVKIYNENKSNKVRALDGATLSVARGESLSVMGVSGSGKSTLLHIIGCLDVVTSGDYILDGNNVGKLSAIEQAKLRNEKIGFILQTFGLLESENVFNNVKLPLLIGKKYGYKEVKTRVQEVLKLVGLSMYSKRKVRELSGGQKQRVAIARALVNDPDIILADEPTSALDSKTAEEIMGLFAELNKKGKTIIIVTHDIKVAEKMSRIVNIIDGKIEHTTEVDETGTQVSK